MEKACPFRTAQGLIAGKYKQQILWLLMEHDMRFSELRRKLPEISPKVLTQQLRELETDEIVVRTVYNQVPPKVEYSLTALGRSTRLILTSLRDWGEQYLRKKDIAPACGDCDI